MARLPSQRYLIQQIGDAVILFEEGTEREIVRYEAGDIDAMLKAQKAIHGVAGMNSDDKTMAHFWSGYFYGRMVFSTPGGS